MKLSTSTEWPHRMGLPLLAGLSAAAFAAMVWLVLSGRAAAVDYLVQDKVSQINTPFLDGLMRWVTDAAHPAVLLVISLIWAAVRARDGKRRDGVAVLAGVGGSIISQFLMKQVFERIRPAAGVSLELGYSFPSGHATTAAAFFLLVIYFFTGRFKRAGGKVAFICVNLLLCLLVGFSRIYLDVHWTSDVVGGFALGTAWASFVLLFLRPGALRPPSGD